MDYGIFCVGDRKSGLYGMPFFQVNEECAKREFIERFKDYPFKGDLSLYYIGGYSTETGKLLDSNVLNLESFIMDYPSEE
jgi:hypothetical protein